MTGGINRYRSHFKALRKRKLDLHVTPYYNASGMYDNLHQYSKNKIHCSCPMCSAKTRNKGKRREKANGYSPSINYKISDLRKVQAMEYQESNQGELV